MAAQRVDSMGHTGSEIAERQVRVYTTEGLIEGHLKVSAMLRTLDDLNITTKQFVTIHDADVEAGTLNFRPGTLSVNRDNVLFVVEQTPPQRRRATPSFGFTRAGTRLRIGSFDVEGFVHVPPGGTPMSRINQDNHPFMALTSGSVSRGEEQFAVPFLAINRRHVLAAQELYDHSEGSAPETAETAGVTLR